MTQSYAGKVVVVTGANSGIGETVAVQFEQAGAKVFGVARRKEALEAARAKHPLVSWLLADVAQASQINAALEAAVKEAGRLDVLVNNAGTFALGSVEQSAEQMIRSLFESNVFGLVFSTQAALAALKASKGTIVNISSAAGHKPIPGGSIYAATKAAVESLTRSWALELASSGVRVNAIAPGPTETPVFEKIGLPAEMVPEVKKEFVKQVPLGRIASTDEVARWVLQVADPSVTWLTGQVLSIDGGMSLT